MSRLITGRVLTTAVMLAIFTGMALMALGFPEKARMVPLVLSVPGALLCLGQLVVDFRWGDESGGAAEPVPPLSAQSGLPAAAYGSAVTESEAPEGNSEATMMAWLAAFTVILLGLGFTIGGPLAVLAYIRFCNHESWGKALFAAAGTFLVIWGVFSWLLELSLFNGFVLERIL